MENLYVTYTIWAKIYLAFFSIVQSNLVIRNVLIRNKSVLRNHFLLPIFNLLYKIKEQLALRNNFSRNVLSAPIFLECRSAPAPCQKKECHSHIAPDFESGAQEWRSKEWRSLTLGLWCMTVSFDFCINQHSVAQ